MIKHSEYKIHQEKNSLFQYYYDDDDQKPIIHLYDLSSTPSAEFSNVLVVLI